MGFSSKFTTIYSDFIDEEDKKLDFNQPGIYLILNFKRNKRYIGSSVNIRNRLREHLKTLLLNRHTNKHLQACFNKSGKDCFRVMVLEFLPNVENVEANLKLREQFWINGMNPHYNQVDVFMSEKAIRSGYIVYSLNNGYEFIKNLREYCRKNSYSFVGFSASAHRSKTDKFVFWNNLFIRKATEDEIYEKKVLTTDLPFPEREKAVPTNPCENVNYVDGWYSVYKHFKINGKFKKLYLGCFDSLEKAQNRLLYIETLAEEDLLLFLKERPRLDKIEKILADENKGVLFKHNKWYAQTNFKNKTFNLGIFFLKEKARKCYIGFWCLDSDELRLEWLKINCPKYNYSNFTLD